MTYAYIRVSGESQAQSGRDGMPRQRVSCADFAAKNRMTIDQWFEEPISGSEDIDKREALIDLLNTAKAGDTVLIDRLDRLARQVGIQEYVLLTLRKRSVTVLSTSAAEKADATDPMEIAIRQMFAVFAQLEAAMIQRRTATARAKKRAAWRRGEGPRCDGRKPYGEHKDPLRAAAELEGLKMIRELSEQGRRPNEIAMYLNDAMVPTRAGGRWHARTVWGILGRHGRVDASPLPDDETRSS
jgi:DNA invertase Pin-like site-specific DNA recombinase